MALWQSLLSSLKEETVPNAAHILILYYVHRGVAYLANVHPHFLSGCDTPVSMFFT